MRDLTLSYYDLLRIEHRQLHLGEQEVDKLFLIFENIVFIQDILEDKLDYLMLQTGGNVLNEQFQLLLVLLLLLGELQEAHNSRLNVRRDLDILHGRIDLVQLFLEGVSFLVQILDENSHISEDIGVDNSA